MLSGSFLPVHNVVIRTPLSPEALFLLSGLPFRRPVGPNSHWVLLSFKLLLGGLDWVWRFLGAP